jgi:putative copper export protein/mono/diheme cytochrome c family protein
VTQILPWLLGARGLHLAGSLSLAGVLVFGALVAPTRPRWLVRASAAAALVGGVAWLLLQTADWGASQEVVALYTRFGQMLLLRLALLAGAALLADHLPRVAALVASLAVLLQAAVGHGVAGGDDLLAAALALHLLAASCWLGGLAPLWIALGGADGARATQRFSRLALACVLVLGGTAVLFVIRLEGGVPGLVGTAHGRIALCKLALFLALLACAAFNRVVLTPALPASAARLRASISVEMILGAAVVTLAAALSSVPPGAHEQPDWPFAWQPSLVALAEPEFLREVVVAGAALLAACVLMVFALLGGRLLVAWMRLGLAAWAVIVVALALPHLDLLLVPASRTSFYRSPTGFSATAIMAGAAAYGPSCAACHGAGGRGDGPVHGPVPAADLTAGHLWDHADGEMFAVLTDGIVSPRGEVAMPAMAGVLDEETRWALIDFLRARNAGIAMISQQAWPVPVAAPDFEALCPDGATVRLSDLRGTVLFLVADARGLLLRQPARTCIANETTARQAADLIAGGLADGDWLVVDAAGWLRARGHAADPASVLDRARTDAATPLPAAAASAHIH